MSGEKTKSSIIPLYHPRDGRAESFGVQNWDLAITILSHVFLRSCYCSRKFYSPQAFGGHQNAHRLERTLARRSRELTSVTRHPPEWNCDSSRSAFDTNGSTHVYRVQPPVVVGIQDQELSAGSHEMGINIDYGYKGASVEDGFNHIDLSLRL
ncbi:hypothetical protein E3N88_28501 [Mikania micrantha]|uniref:C2H2-type domain-containing protein n=1 Tax=Mikania micrantha TaxID=192012 RepID=A0A5N6N0U0_9ASTR|nr:hypothetical protein E3N88_28501 [Mikania micrantha]